MGDKWKEYRIGEIGQVIGGGTPSTKDEANFGGSIPWLTPKDLSGYPYRYISHGERNITEKGLSNSSAKLLPAKSVLLTTRAPVGYVAIAKNPVTTNQGFRSLVLREGFDPEFVYYLLKINTEFLKNHTSGTTFGELSGSTLKNLKFLFPPLHEQKAIASILGALDDKIELNRKMNETLEAMARAIFKSWFVDFDPIPGLGPHKEWQDSPLGKIPKGWRVGTLGELCKKPQYGFTASAKDYRVGKKFLRITDINKQAWIDWTSVPYCEITTEQFEQYRVKTGDILIARMADPGHSVLIEEDADAVFASYLIRFRPIKLEYSRYLQYWLRSPEYWGLVNARSAGTTRASLNAQILGTFQLVIPSENVVIAFKNAIDTIRSKVNSNVKESNTLASIRDALLPKLLSGEIRVKNAERFVEGVV